MSTTATSIFNFNLTLSFKKSKQSEPYYVLINVMTKYNYFIIVNDYYYFNFSNKEYIINYMIIKILT